MILRELFSRIVVDVKAAIADVSRFDSAMDDASDGLKKTEKQSKKLGGELKDSAKKGKKFGDAVAGAFKKAGRAAFNARGKFKDAGVGIGKAMKSTAVAAAAASLAAGALTLKWAENSQELQNLAIQYQLSTDEIQGFTGALSQIGLDAGDGLEMIKELRIRMGEAKLEGSTPLKAALRDLGIGFKQFSALPLIDQLGLVADRLEEVEDQSRKTQLQNDIAGDDMIKLAPFFDKGSKAMKKLAERSKELGLVQNKISIKAGVELAKAWKTVFTIGKSLFGLVSSKLEPTFKSLIDTTQDWILANREFTSGKLVEFFEKLVAVTADFIPLAADFATGLLDIIHEIGGVEGAITGVLGGMAAWKLSTVTLLGPAGPWIAGLTAVIALIGVMGARVDAEDRRITRLGQKRRKGLAFRRRGDFTTEDLEAAGDPGREVLDLESEIDALTVQRQKIQIGEDIEESRKFFREANKQQLSGMSGRDLSSRLVELDFVFDQQVEAAGKLEDRIERLTKSIDLQINLIHDERTRQANEKSRDKSAKDAETSAKKAAEEKKQRARSRELLAEFRRDPDKFGKKETKELIAILTGLGLELPEGLVKETKGKGTKKDKKKEKTIEELIGLGPDGIKTISDLVPAGQGTTINNFSFSTVVQPANVDIVVNSPEGTSAIDIAQETSERFGRVQSDVIHQDQRELIGQLQG